MKVEKPGLSWRFRVCVYTHAHTHTHTHTHNLGYLGDFASRKRFCSKTAEIGASFIFHQQQQDPFVALDLFSERVLYFEQRTIFGAVSLAEILKSLKIKIATCDLWHGGP